jgi:hypothetical protein
MQKAMQAVDERRRHERLAKPMDGSWRGQSGATSCRITDISWSGCFLETLTVPSIGEPTVVTVPAAGRMNEIPGQIVYVERGHGIAVRFDKLTADQIDALTGLLGEPPTSVF